MQKFAYKHKVAQYICCFRSFMLPQLCTGATEANREVSIKKERPLPLPSYIFILVQWSALWQAESTFRACDVTRRRMQAHIPHRLPWWETKPSTDRLIETAEMKRLLELMMGAWAHIPFVKWWWVRCRRPMEGRFVGCVWVLPAKNGRFG